MSRTIEQTLREENDELRRRLDEAESVVRAISKHEVDAFVVEREGEDSVLVLDGVDKPYRLLTERMKQGAAIITSDGTIIYANRRMAELIAAPSQSLLAANYSDYLSNADRPFFRELLKTAESGSTEQELQLQRSDGTRFPALLNFASFIEENHIVCLIVTDLTQQKRHEAERERFVQEQAARAAAEQVANVLRANDRRKDEFLAMLGHELRNPLAPLSNGLHILNLIGSKESEGQQTREMMSRQLESLIRLVDDLLDVSRVTQGKITLQRTFADLKNVALRAIESCRAYIEEHEHRVDLELPDYPVPVQVDLVRLTQVVTNLLNNATKFTPKGGRIRVIVETSGQSEGVVRVVDNGKGISPEILPRVFELFAQADPSVSRSEGGLGIGLTLSRRLVELHGGMLDAGSAGLGRGSEFVVRLPLARAPHEAAADGLTADSKSGEGTGNKRILVVDDNRDTAQSMAIILRLLGHDVREAYNGIDALKVMEDFVPHLLILDIGLPGMNGYDVARNVRLQPRLSNVRIIALSGYGGIHERHRSEDSGIDAYFVKPVEFSVIQSILNSKSP